jgi:F-type H+-transporting ATPase subunit epsilon
MSMQANLKLLILTPDKVFYEGEVAQVIVTTPEGEMGIMAQHMPIIAVIPESDLVIIQGDGRRHEASVSQGFLDLTETDLEIFVDSAEWAEDIDVGRAEAALHRAEERLSDKQLSHTEYLRTHAAVSRATARIRAAKSR